MVQPRILISTTKQKNNLLIPEKEAAVKGHQLARIFAEHCSDTVKTRLISVFNGIDNHAIRVNNIKCQRDSAIQAVSCAGHSGVVGTDSHLHLVQYALIIFSILDQ